MLCAADGIRCWRQYICSLLVTLQRVTPWWLHSDADAIDVANTNTQPAQSALSHRGDTADFAGAIRSNPAF